MNDAIKELEAKITKHCKESFRCDEDLFNLGVELGRLLEKQKITSYRPTYFVDAENKNNLFEKKIAIIRRIDNSIEYLLKNAIAEYIDANGPFEFSANRHSSSSDKFDQELSNKFHIQVVRTTQREVGGSFEVELSLTNEIAKIFKKYNESTSARAQVDNSTGDTHETIYRRESVEKIFSVDSNISAHYTKLTPEELENFANEIEKIIVWFNMSLSNPIQVSRR